MDDHLVVTDETNAPGPITEEPPLPGSEAAAPSVADDKPKRRSGWISWLLTIAIAASAVGAILWSGLALNIVATDSMVPTLDPTDMVVMVDPKIDQPEVGKIIVFTAQFFETYIPPHVHRIVGVEPNGDWITKGDNASQVDPWRVKPADVEGVVIGSVPTAVVRNPILLGGALFVVLAILFWPRAKKEPAAAGEPEGNADAAATDSPTGTPPGDGTPAGTDSTTSDGDAGITILGPPDK